MEDREKKFGDDLREWRQRSGMSRDALGKLLGNLSGRTIQGVELGHQRLGKAARRMAEQLMAGKTAAVSIAGAPAAPGTGSCSPAVEQVIAAMLDPKQIQRAQAVAAAMDIPLSRAWSIVIRECLTHKGTSS